MGKLWAAGWLFDEHHWTSTGRALGLMWANTCPRAAHKASLSFKDTTSRAARAFAHKPGAFAIHFQCNRVLL